MQGIYRIHCTANGRSYIGSSIHIKKRWQCHRSDLKNKTHRNRHLQNAWLKYGSKAFEWSVLELVAEAGDLIEREQHWIDQTGKKFNIRILADRNNGLKHSPETIAKMIGRKLSPEHRAKLSAASKLSWAKKSCAKSFCIILSGVR